MLPSIEHRIATELGVRPAQVAAAVRLLDEGSTVPRREDGPRSGAMASAFAKLKG